MLINRNVTVGGRRTSLRLEPEFWDALADIAGREGLSLDHLCGLIDSQRGGLSRTAAIRIYIVGYNSLMCCLATIIEGYHRGHDLTFVKDASLARATPDADERTAHLHVTNIVSFYANVTTTAEVLAPALVDLSALPAVAQTLSYGTG